MRRRRWISEVEHGFALRDRMLRNGKTQQCGSLGEGVVLQGLGKMARLTLPGLINSSHQPVASIQFSSCHMG